MEIVNQGAGIIYNHKPFLYQQCRYRKQGHIHIMHQVESQVIG
jgi:hypothetical protein